MESIYTSYYCKKCKRTTILITEELNDAIRHGNYISCAFCGSKKVVKEKITDSLKEVMSERKYKRVNGALRQY